MAACLQLANQAEIRLAQESEAYFKALVILKKNIAPPKVFVTEEKMTRIFLAHELYSFCVVQLDKIWSESHIQ